MEQKVRVLVTDDEEAIRKLLSQILSASGFEVLLACNGKEAVESVKRDHPQVILLDLTMPELDGFEACKQIRQNSENHNIPIMMLTGREEESSIISGSCNLRIHDLKSHWKTKVLAGMALRDFRR